MKHALCLLSVRRVSNSAYNSAPSTLPSTTYVAIDDCVLCRVSRPVVYLSAVESTVCWALRLAAVAPTVWAAPGSGGGGIDREANFRTRLGPHTL